MSAAKENPCRKFQANIFNKSKCQNCFKPRELHLLTDQDLNQAKPIYGGWLCLAPEGTDFDNPMHRSRKWQRRFFVLYEHGCLRFALDESPSTLPQGTVNMNLCTDVIDAEPKTGQKNALCIITPDQEYYIRGDNKEIINGYVEQLVVYPRTNKQNQKKKRKVEPTTSQEPGPAKVAVTGSGIPEAEKVPDSSSIIWQEELHNREADVSQVWSSSEIVPQGSQLPTVFNSVSFACSGRSNVIEKLEALELENSERMEVEETGRSETRQGRSEMRPFFFLSSQWKKYWFVLTDHSLRYYKDSIAEEASDLDGEIDLSTCYNVTEYQAQRNYGFQIHTQEGVHTLSAMTAGIRRNWIQAVMKNVRPSTAPDVASLARPDITQDSPSSETSSVEREPKKSRARDRRREGRSKTFDWAEFRPIAQALAQQRIHEADALQAQLADPERSKRREERRRRYESVTGSSSLDPAADNSKMDLDSVSVGLGTVSPPSPDRQQKVEDEIEQRWQQVEKTPIREERRVPLSTSLQTRETAELEKLLESYKKGLESPLSLDTKPQMKRPELVSSQAQSLTKKYQETKELLQLQELKKRNMQAQLGLSLSHLSTKEPYFSDTKNTSTSEILPSEPIVKTVIFELVDNEGKIRELEDLIDSGKPLSVKEMIELLHSHSDSVLSDFPIEKSEDGRSGDITNCQKLLESLKTQQEIENETMRKSLAKAGDSIRNYEARLITMEDMLGRVQRQKMEDLKNPCTSPCQRDESSQMTNRGLAQKVELLTSENEALNQRYQEIVNQLREADREIDRLKAELQRHQSGHQYQLDRENQSMMDQEDKDVLAFKNSYEQELNDKSQKLQEALAKLEVLGHSLKDIEKRLQLKEATLKGLGFQASENGVESLLEKEQLRHHIEVIESKLSEKEKLLQSADQTCKELQAQNEELQTEKQESERNFNQVLLEAKEEIRMLREKGESDNECGVDSDCQAIMQSDEGMIQEVMESFKRRSNALNQVLSMLMKASESKTYDLSSFGIEEETVGRNDRGMVKVLFESEILSRVLDGVENSQHGEGCERTLTVMKNVVKHMLMENRVLVSVMKLSAEQKDIQTPVNMQSTEYGSMLTGEGIVVNDALSGVIMKELTEAVQNKATLLNQIVSVINEPVNELLQSLALTLSSHVSPQGQCFLEAVLDVTHTYLLIGQRIQLENELESSKAVCASCQLKEQNMELELKQSEELSTLQNSVNEDSKLVTHIQIEGEPIDSLDKAIQLQDMVAKHKKELRELREVYEQEASKLRQEVTKAGETLRLRSEENVKEIDSLTICMENLKDKHQMERNILLERFNQEMVELNDALGLHGADLADDGKPNPASLKQQIQKLVLQVSVMTEEMKSQDRGGEAALLRLKYEKDLENLKATCERGFAAMEESHQKVIDELQRKHQRELENLQEEKERLLAEETAATIAAIEAMKNAHRSELEKELDKARKANSNTENADIEEIRRQHEEELLSFQREIEVLSEQYSQKCLENAHLAQALEAERQALRQCQRENQELNAHNQELNNRLAAEITKMRSMTSEEGGEAGTAIQGKELYELEVMLRVKESEVQYLKQEINSLKDELQAAQRDKKYATDKYKDIYTELSIVKAKAERDLGRLRDQLQLAHEALGEPTLEEVQRGGYDIMKSKSNPDILKMAAAAAKRSERAMRSKVSAYTQKCIFRKNLCSLSRFYFCLPFIFVI
uniref:PH domain-containing protein n=1 Tax=Pygocentrus nattereri TaxID=42514 RepID=A0AAR2JLT4_PYGNA